MNAKTINDHNGLEGEKLTGPFKVSVKGPSTNEPEPTIGSPTVLASMLVGDVAVATGVTVFVAPLLAVIDKAIVQSAAGSHTLIQSGIQSMKEIRRKPLPFLRSKPFLLIWGVYGATFSTANCLKTLSEHREYTNVRKDTSARSPKDASLSKLGVFAGTTVVNSTCAIIKDREYARVFGTQSSSAVIPRMTYAMWMVRDVTIVGSSFILPDLLCGPVAKTFDMDEKAARDVCQLSLPLLSQLVAAPLHYMGLDMYNRNLSMKSWSEAIVDRSRSLYHGVGPVLVGRAARMVPGYSVAGVFNARLRDGWRESLIHREINSMMRDPNKESASKLVSLIHGKNQAAGN